MGATTLLTFDPMAFLAVGTILFGGLFTAGGGGPPDRPNENDGNPPATSQENKRPADCSLREIKKQIIIRNQELDRIEDDINELETEYKRHLKDGAEAGPGGNRQVAAVRARLAKFKLQMTKLRRLQTVKNLIVWEVAKAQREVADELQKHGFGQNIDVESALQFDPDTFQRQLDEMRAGLQQQFTELEEVMSTPDMDLEGLTPDIQEEFQIMEQIQEDELDPSELGVSPTAPDTDTQQSASSGSPDVSSTGRGLNVDVNPEGGMEGSAQPAGTGEADDTRDGEPRAPEEILHDALQDLQASMEGPSVDNSNQDGNGGMSNE